MSVWDRIKSEVAIDSLLDVMGIKYNVKKWIWDEGKFSDSYNFSIQHNIVTNHNQAKDYRAQGNPLEFYIKKTGATHTEALEFFEKHFGIRSEEKEKLKPIEDLPILTDIQRLSSYLYLRGIDYSRLPEGFVTLTRGVTYGKLAPKGETLCMQGKMYDDESKLTGTQLRSLIGKGFYTNGNDGYFYHFTKNLTNEYIFVVEGFTDTLSLRQFDEHVLGFKSSKTPPSEKIIGFLNKFKKIYLLFDNDPAGKAAKDKFKSMIDANVYEIEEEEDVNELTKQLGESIVEMIKASAILTQQKTFEHIEYDEGLDLGYAELKARSIDTVISYGYQNFDDHLGYILPGQLIVVGGVAGIGKSTMVNNIANNIARQGFIVGRHSLEDRLEETRINEIYYRLVQIREARKERYPSHSRFEANMYTEQEYPGIEVDIQQAVKDLRYFNKGIIDLSHKKMVGIEELENLFKDLVLNKKAQVIIIDHLHYVKFNKDQRHDLAIEEFMHILNDLLRKYKVACILVSHYRKLNKDKNNQEQDPDNDSFKDGAAIAQVANKIIHIARDTTEVDNESIESGRSIKYIVTKNRGKSWLGVMYGRFHNGRIIMKESDLSKERRIKKKGW